MEDTRIYVLIPTGGATHTDRRDGGSTQRACTTLYYMGPRAERSGHMPESLTQEPSTVDNHFQIKNYFFQSSYTGQTNLSKGPMPSSTWPTENKSKAVFGGSSPHNAASGFIFYFYFILFISLQVLHMCYVFPFCLVLFLERFFMCVMASIFCFIYFFGTTGCVSKCVSFTLPVSCVLSWTLLLLVF